MNIVIVVCIDVTFVASHTLENIYIQKHATISLTNRKNKTREKKNKLL